MKVGSLVTGIILLIIGVSLYGYLQTNASDCSSFVGQLGRALSPNVAQKCQTVALVQVFGLILAVIGLGVLIYGAVAKSKSREYYPPVKEKDTAISPPPSSSREESAEEKNIRNLGILKERLARGEITKEKYDELKKVFEPK